MHDLAVGTTAFYPFPITSVLWVILFFQYSAPIFRFVAEDFNRSRLFVKYLLLDVSKCRLDEHLYSLV